MLTSPQYNTRHRATRRTAMFVLFYGLLGFWWPYDLIFSRQFLVENTSIEFWIALGIQQYCAVRLSLLATSGKPHFLALTFFLFVYVWVGLAGTLQIYVGIWPWRVKHSPDQIWATMLVLLLAIMSYEMGRNLHRIRPPPHHEVQTWRITFRVALPRILLLAAFALPAAIYGAYYFGFDNLFSTRATFTSGVAAGSAKSGVLLARALLRSPSLAALFLAIYYALDNWSSLTRHQKRWTLGIVTALLLLNAITNYPAVQARYWLAAMFITPLFAFLPWRKGHMALWVLFLSFVLLWVYPRADLFRHAKTWDEAIENLFIKEQKNDYFFTGDYDVLQATANAVVYVDSVGAMHGKNLLGATLFYIPRPLWPTKPMGSGEAVAKAVGYRFTNLSMPLWAETFIAFKWLGIIFLMAVYGYLSASGDAALVRSKVEKKIRCEMWALLVSFWAAFQFFLIRGDLMNAVAYSSLCLALIFLGGQPRIEKHP